MLPPIVKVDTRLTQLRSDVSLTVSDSAILHAARGCYKPNDSAIVVLTIHKLVPRIQYL